MADPYLPNVVYWENEPVTASYPKLDWTDWAPPPICSCEAEHDHNIWTHVYRLLTINKKIWRRQP